MVGTMIVAAIAGTTAAGVAASFALTAAAFAVNFAVSYIVNRVFAPDVDRNQNQNNREQIPPTTDNSIPVVYGDAYLGGTFVDAVLTTDQQKMYYTLAISSISSNGQFTFDQSNFYYGGRLIEFDPAEPGKVIKLIDDAGNEDTRISGKLFIYLFTSTQAGVITPINSSGTPPSGIMSVANGVPSGQEWPVSGRQMNGTAFAIVVMYYNTDAGTTSLQPITFKVSHTLNSTGVAKPGDVWYDYMTNSVYGCAVDPAYVDSASATTLNTYADGLITYTPSGGGSATQARYRINGVLTGNVSALENIEKVLNCCDTWMTYNAASGQWKVIPNKTESTAYAFDDDNIVGEIRVSATDITASVNQIEARFPFKENKDQPNFVFIQTPSNLLYPNEPVNKSSVTYELVNDSVQAQYLANRVLEQAREDLIVSFNTTYYGIQVDAGDVISVTNADYGWSAKLFRVLKVNEVSLPDGQLGARLEMSEYSAAVYDDFDITQYVPVPNSGIAAPEYFSPLNAPVVIASRPSAAVPSFDVQVSTASSGLATFITLYYATSPSPAATDWRLLSNISVVTGVPYTPGASYTFFNQVLPTGVYYFSFVIGNETGASARSPTSAPFNWAPVAATGPTGPTGSIGPTGPTGTGDTGPRSALIYFFYNTAQATAPSAPSTAQVAYDFNTSAPTITAPGWSSTFSPSAVGVTTASNKYWAVRVIFQENTFGGSYTETISSVFTWQNFDGLVTFTNLANSQGPLGTTTTFIDGGSITTDSLTVSKIKSSSAAILSGRTFGLGQGASAFGLGATIVANTTDSSANGILSVGGSTAYAGFGVVGATSNSGTSTAGGAFGNATSTAYSSWRAYGLIGQANQAGTFLHIASNNTGIVANATYAFYAQTGGYGPFTGEHDALLAKTASVQPGDILCDTGFAVVQETIDTITEVEVSSAPNQPSAVGVFHLYTNSADIPSALSESITDPTTGLQTRIIKPEYEPLLVTNNLVVMASLGEGTINVCGENGNIAVGDLIVTSSMAGKGMKQADDLVRSYTVAKARQAVSFASPTEIKQIACIYMCG